MTAPYDLSFTNSTNPTQIIGGANAASGGILAIGICAIIYFVFIKGGLDAGYGIGKSLLAASFVLIAVSGLLLGLGWIPMWVLSINLVVFVASIFLSVFGDK